MIIPYFLFSLMQWESFAEWKNVQVLKKRNWRKFNMMWLPELIILED